MDVNKEDHLKFMKSYYKQSIIPFWNPGELPLVLVGSADLNGPMVWFNLRQISMNENETRNENKLKALDTKLSNTAYAALQRKKQHLNVY